ncbi:WD40 repeat-like protein [Piromyces finnis]|uniref:WD40 repeat-like protein n=1 Tax=Piromyces finnis TaxID=1754191 RepID=A0A1Y1V533_9FUNG|nr:WD40 repeat-like protein [Piromyces finnis]|eukprot:ORX47551.1 WD40 repeat-like protein [Piromyces finnis]
MDNSLNLSYLIKQSSLNQNDDNNSNSVSSTSNNSRNNISVKRENSKELNNSISIKKAKSENLNNSTNMNRHSETVNVIPQIPQYDYQLNSINSTFSPYPNYSGVNLFNTIMPNPVQPQYYILQNKNQVPVISNYTSGNSSPQYINVNPLNMTSPVNSAQITTPIGTPIAQQISGQIPTQIPSQISPQLSSPIAQQVNPLIPVQSATNVYPIFNMNKDTNSNQKKVEKNINNNQAKVIDLTESDSKSKEKEKEEIEYKSISELNNNLENDNKYTILDKIKFARKKQEYFYNLSQKYTEFINNATNKLISLQEKAIGTTYSETNKYNKPNENIIKVEIESSEKIKSKIETPSSSKNISNEEKKSSDLKSKNTVPVPTEKKVNSIERNVIIPPSLKEHLINLKKRNSSENVNNTNKKIKTISQDIYSSSKETDSNHSSYNKSSVNKDNKPSTSISEKISSNNNSSLYNNKSPSYNRLSTFNNKSSLSYNTNNNIKNNSSAQAINKYSSNNVANSQFSNIKTTNQKEGSIEIKVCSQNTKSRLFSKSIEYERKITDRKPRKFIHLQNSHSMIVTSLGGEILFYDTKNKEEISSIQAPAGGWPEDICSISNDLFAISTLSKNRNKCETQIAIISTKHGLEKPRLQSFKEFKPHDNGSIRIAYIGESDNTLKLLSAGSDHKIFLWDIKGDGKNGFKPDKVSFIHERHSSAIQALCYNSWNNTVYSGGSDCKLFGFNLNTRRTTFQNRYDMRISSILRNPVDVNQLLIMSSATKDQFRICDIRSRKTVMNFGIPTNENTTQYAYPDIHKDGYLISFGSQNTDERNKAAVYIWDIRYISPNNSYVSDIKLEQGRIIKPLFSPIKSQLITIDTNGKAAFVDYQILKDPVKN